MKVLLLAFLVAFVAPAHARIGDTESQLKDRFGRPVSREDGRNASLTFVFSEWIVTCDMIDGVCARIGYAKIGEWSEEVFEKLLVANGERSSWTDLTAPNLKKLQRKWKRDDGTLAHWVAGCLVITSPRYEKAQALSDKEALIAATNS